MTPRAMNVTFACPDCGQTSRAEFQSDSTAIACAACGQKLTIPPGAVSEQQVNRCLACPSTDLYVRKDFPQRLGVGLVVLGIVGSSVAWYFMHIYWTYGILFATAFVDLMLYALVGNALMCYRCGAQYRNVENMDRHGDFQLETHERYRQLAARLEGKG